MNYLNESLLVDKDVKFQIKEDHLIESLILEETLTITEAKKLLTLIEQMHQNTEAQVKSWYKKKLEELVKKYTERIKKARAAVASAKQEGKSAKIIDKMIVRISNLKQDFQLKKHELKVRFNKRLAEVKARVNQMKGVVKLKAISSKYPKSVKALKKAGKVGAAAGAGALAYKLLAAKNK